MNLSRGAFKLKGCLDQYHVGYKRSELSWILVQYWWFTDVCLRYGAKKVYALDVWAFYSLPRNLKEEDSRVVKMEGHNARNHTGMV